MTDEQPQSFTNDQAFQTLCGACDASQWRYTASGRSISALFGSNTGAGIHLSVEVKDGVMEFKTRSDYKAPMDKLAECAVAINVVNKNLNFGSMYVDDMGMIWFRYSYIFFDACPTIGVIATIIKMAVETMDRYDDIILRGIH